MENETVVGINIMWLMEELIVAHKQGETHVAIVTEENGDKYLEFYNENEDE